MTNQYSYQTRTFKNKQRNHSVLRSRKSILKNSFLVLLSLDISKNTLTIRGAKVLQDVKIGFSIVNNS